MLCIENSQIRAEISRKGGILQSLRHRGAEYLWQRDAAYWGGCAPNLFPFVGRLFEGSYLLDGVRYPMDLHGFVRQSELAVEAVTAESCTLLLTDSPRTRICYPFSFAFRVRYQLREATLAITFSVENRGPVPLLCAMGGHPGFLVPLEPGLAYTDYALTFSKPSAPERVEFGPNGLCTGKRTPFPLADGIRLPLTHDLFDQEAVFLTNVPSSVTLSAGPGSRGVTVAYPQMPYVGFWHPAHSEAPLLCIEPWSALPGREGGLEDLRTMPDRIAAHPGETVFNTWSITLF